MKTKQLYIIGLIGYIRSDHLEFMYINFKLQGTLSIHNMYIII